MAEAQKVKLETTIIEDKSAQLGGECAYSLVSQVEGGSSESQELGLGGPSPQQLNSIMHQVEIFSLGF